MTRSIEWTDADGQRVVIHGDRISVYGSVSMTRRDGTVAIGADIPSDVAVIREAALPAVDTYIKNPDFGI